MIYKCKRCQIQCIELPMELVRELCRWKSPLSSVHCPLSNVQCAMSKGQCSMSSWNGRVLLYTHLVLFLAPDIYHLPFFLLVTRTEAIAVAGVFACKSLEAKFNKAGSSFVCNDLWPPFPLKYTRVKNLVSKVLASFNCFVVYIWFFASIRSQLQIRSPNRKGVEKSQKT